MTAIVIFLETLPLLLRDFLIWFLLSRLFKDERFLDTVLTYVFNWGKFEAQFNSYTLFFFLFNWKDFL